MADLIRMGDDQTMNTLDNLLKSHNDHSYSDHDVYPIKNSYLITDAQNFELNRSIGRFQILSDDLVGYNQYQDDMCNLQEEQQRSLFDDDDRPRDQPPDAPLPHPHHALHAQQERIRIEDQQEVLSNYQSGGKLTLETSRQQPDAEEPTASREQLQAAKNLKYQELQNLILNLGKRRAEEAELRAQQEQDGALRGDGGGGAVGGDGEAPGLAAQGQRLPARGGGRLY